MVSRVIALTLPGQGGTELFHSRGHRHSLGDSSVQGFMLLGQRDCEGHAARLGLRTRLESRIPGFWPSSAALSWTWPPCGLNSPVTENKTGTQKKLGKVEPGQGNRVDPLARGTQKKDKHLACGIKEGRRSPPRGQTRTIPPFA